MSRARIWPKQHVPKRLKNSATRNSRHRSNAGHSSGVAQGQRSLQRFTLGLHADLRFRPEKPGFVSITLAPKKLIRTRRASEGSASEPSLARRVSMCKDVKLSCRGNMGGGNSVSGEEIRCRSIILARRDEPTP